MSSADSLLSTLLTNVEVFGVTLNTTQKKQIIASTLSFGIVKEFNWSHLIVLAALPNRKIFFVPEYSVDILVALVNLETKCCGGTVLHRSEPIRLAGTYIELKIDN